MTINSVSQRSSQANLFSSCGGIYEIVFSGAAKTFVIQYDVGSGTASIQNARIRIWQKS